MLQDVECPEKPNVDEHVTDGTQKKAMEDPAHAEENGKCRKTYLRKRLREASTKKAKKRCSPDKAKTLRALRDVLLKVRENYLTQVPWRMLKC